MITPEHQNPEQRTVKNDKESIVPKVLAGLGHVVDDLNKKLRELEEEVAEAKRKILGTLP